MSPQALPAPRMPRLVTQNQMATGTLRSHGDPHPFALGPRASRRGACPHLRPPLCRPPARRIIFKLTAECALLILTSTDKPRRE